MAERFLKFIPSEKCPPNRLPCKVVFDRVIATNEKDPVLGTRSLFDISDSAKSEMDVLDDSILVNALNSVNGRGA